jgi:hypothetical protein
MTTPPAPLAHKSVLEWTRMAGVKPLVMYVIYDRPKDYPNLFVLRRWQIEGGVEKPLNIMATGPTVAEVRKSVPAGSIRMPVYDNDDPVILEVWL